MSYNSKFTGRDVEELLEKAGVYVTDFTFADYDKTIDIDSLVDAVVKCKPIFVPFDSENSGFSTVVSRQIDDEYVTLYCYLSPEYNPVRDKGGEFIFNYLRDTGELDETLFIPLPDDPSGYYLPLTGGTLTGPVVFKNGGRISVDSSDNLNLSIGETLYIDNDVRSTYGDVTLEEGVFEYANAEGGYTKATGVAYKKVDNFNRGTVTLRDDIFYDFTTTTISGNVIFALGAKHGSGHYMFRFYVQSGYSVTLPNTLYFLGDEPTEGGCVYEVSIYHEVTVCVKIGQRNGMGGQ